MSNAVHSELNEKAVQLRVRFFSFIGLIAVLIITAGFINYYLNQANEQLEIANRLNQQQFTDLQQISEKFRFITTRGSTISPRTLELVRKDLLQLTSNIQRGQKRLQALFEENKFGYNIFWPQELYSEYSRLSESETKVIRWIHQTVSNTEQFFDKNSLYLTKPLESTVLLHNPWHTRLISSNEQFDKHIQFNCRTTRTVILSSLVGLFFILWTMYSTIIRSALFKLQNASTRFQSKLDLQTSFAAFLEDVSSEGKQLFDSDTDHSKVLNKILHKQVTLKQCDLEISNDLKNLQETGLRQGRLCLAEKLSCSGLKEQLLYMTLPAAMQEYQSDVLPFLKALANHLSALFEIRLRLTAESQRDTYYQIADTAINALPTPVVVFDESLHVMLINPACLSFFPDLKYNSHSDITLHDIALHNKALIAANADLGSEAFIAGSAAEFSIPYANNTNVVWSRLPVNKLGIVFIGHDITTIRDDLTEKEHNHRLKYLGQMSVSVAHDTNNYLAIIMNVLEIIGLQTTLTEDSQVLLQEAIKSCQKASSISRQLVSFTQRQNLTPKIILPATVRKYVEEFLVNKFYNDILFTVDLEEEACLFCDPDHLQRSILNIIKNSVEAMQSEGTLNLSIRSKNSYLVCITISDTGPGFSTNDFENATDTFYTNKDGAAGLGLAGVHGFTRQSNGSLSLHNNINGGATIELLLPKSHVAMSDEWEDKVLPEITDSYTKGISILLIEDNEMLRDLIIVEFERVGYTIDSACTVEQGLSRLASLDKLDVLVTDIILPDGLGFRVAQELNDYFPRTEVVYVTGYSTEEYASEIQKRPGHVIEKPFSIRKLINLVEQAHK